MTEAALWLIALVMSVAITIVVTEPIQYFAAQLLGRAIPFPKLPRRATGIWLSAYRFESEGEYKIETQINELRQVGKYVVGRSHTKGRYTQSLHGKIENQMYLTGIWRNILQGNAYHGCFQLFLHPSGNRMSGKWVGYDSHQRIQHGFWVWMLIGENSGGRSNRLALEKYQKGQFESTEKKLLEQLRSLDEGQPGT